MAFQRHNGRRQCEYGRFLVETAKANGLDPQKYLQYLLDKRPSSEMTEEELEQFLPWSSEAKATCSKKVE